MILSKKVNGGCLCGEVKFSISDDFSAFYQCHCKQCQHLTGSAFASNVLTEPNNIVWLTGTDNVKNFNHPTREFSKSFCLNCGSALPYINKSQTSLVVPAGSLFDVPSIKLQANLFTAEKASWFNDGLAAESFDGFPTKS